MFSEKNKLRLEILNKIVQLVGILSAGIAFVWYGYDQINYEIATRSADPVEINAKLEVIKGKCNSDDCKYKVSSLFEVTNISKQPYEISYSRTYYYLLPADAMKKNEIGKDFVMIKGPQKGADFNKADEFGWEKIYDQRYLINTRSDELIEKEKKWIDAEIGGGLTGKLAPREKTGLENDFYITTPKGGWIAAKIYLEIDYGYKGHKHRFKTRWIELETQSTTLSDT
jgi:hypothetical protein